MGLAAKVRSLIGDQLGAQVVEYQIEKALESARNNAGEQKSAFYDPLTMYMGRPWVDRQGGRLTFSDMRRMVQNPIIGSIIQTRVNQVASFCQPQKHAYDFGFRIVAEEAEQTQPKIANAITRFIYEMGIPGYGEESLESFCRKFVRDSLTMDQACAEIVFDRAKRAAYVIVVDAATIRRLERSLHYGQPLGNEPAYVQILHDAIVAQYSQRELIFGVRNPQSDLASLGYGLSELELLIRIVTSIANTEKFNTSQVAQGGTAKGVLVIKGGVANREEYTAFKNDFRRAISQASLFWKPPILSIAKDASIDWLTLDRSNRDMEYARLFDFLVKQACGVYQMDPSEINWNIGATGATTTFESRQEDKIVFSLRRGLKPLLTFIANLLTTHVVKTLDENYRMEFVGLEENRSKDVEIRSKEVTTYKTVNEVRAEAGLEPLEGMDIILNAPAPAAPAQNPAVPFPGATGFEGMSLEQLLAEEDKAGNTAEE